MKINYLAFAVPFFLLLIGLEYYYSKRRGKNFFQFAESIANINVGIAERLLDVFTTGLFYFFFQYLQQHYGLFHIEANWVTWVILFFATDLVWYWYHRYAHEISLFWAVHVVHHQSEDFNYTVSARITVFQAVVRCGFWSILPLLGFPAEMITTLLLIHGLYPFFIHTQTVGKLGWLEKVLVTPSHHRVHHASNPEYLDKNYGDVLIIWDKLFGTFTEEKERPVYGLVTPLNSYSFLWQHFHFPMELWMAVSKTKGTLKKIAVLFSKPASLDPRFKLLLERKLLNPVPQWKPTAALKQYIISQTAVSLFLLFLTLLFVDHLPYYHLLILSLFIIVSLIITGAMLNQRRWIFYLEYSRSALVLTYIGTLFRHPYFIMGLLLLFGGLLYYFQPIKQRYLAILYQKR